MNRPRIAVDLPALAANLEHAVEAVDPEGLPELAGLLESARVRIQARTIAATARPAAEPDRYLTVEEAAELARITPDFIYRNSKNLPFIVRPTPGTVRVSEKRLRKYLENRTG